MEFETEPRPLGTGRNLMTDPAGPPVTRRPTAVHRGTGIAGDRPDASATRGLGGRRPILMLDEIRSITADDAWTRRLSDLVRAGRRTTPPPGSGLVAELAAPARERCRP